MALLALSAVSWLLRRLLPTKIVITRMFIHPIKSCGHIEVQQAFCDKFGLQYDRNWVVIDKDNNPITQRQQPKLAVVQPAINESLGFLICTAPGMPELQIPLIPPVNAPMDIKVARTFAQAVDVGEEAGRWFSTYLGLEGCRLVACTGDREKALRPRNLLEDPKYIGVYQHSDQVFFQDNTPLLLVSEESLWDLNYFLDSPLPIELFRANIVVRGAPAWFEDEVDTCVIGNLALHHCKQCARCLMTTVDQATGTKHPGEQPLTALRKYRNHQTDDRYGASPFFGVNLALEPGNVGVISVGDALHVGRLRQPYPLGPRRN
eukprot:m.30035 g.30035  ORF g.30035 m.30035 type:complete len:319 (-) comp9211_c1_seq1:5309-6265(-)